MRPIDPGPTRWILPDPAKAPAGAELLAVGGDLDPATMLTGYRTGLFPMELTPDVLGWYSPDPRGVLPLSGLHVSRSLRKSMDRFQVTFDTGFAGVVAACADPSRSGHWITRHFEAAYGRLHRLGWAHSVEVWHGGQLVGGLFGVEVGSFFSGESMFRRESDASKVALVALVARLRASGHDHLLDVQWWTPHLGTMGAVALPRDVYLARLRAAARGRPAFD